VSASVKHCQHCHMMREPHTSVALTQYSGSLTALLLLSLCSCQADMEEAVEGMGAVTSDPPTPQLPATKAHLLPLHLRATQHPGCAPPHPLAPHSSQLYGPPRPSLVQRRWRQG
jgi:hypothetical protein